MKKVKLLGRTVNEKSYRQGQLMKISNYRVVREPIIDVKFIDMIDGFRFLEIKLANGELCFKIC